jgi:hypothetical protein
MNTALGPSLAILFLARVPIAVAIGLASVAGIEANGRLPLLLVAQRMFAGIDSFPLMAIPRGCQEFCVSGGRPGYVMAALGP